VTSEPPELAPALPASPEGAYRTPVTPPKISQSAAAVAPSAAGFGTLDLYVQPANADVMIDGQRWLSSEAGHFMVQVPAGKHRVEIGKHGFRQFSTEIEVGEGSTVPLNVSLMMTTS
jgi:hypothetical protein